MSELRPEVREALGDLIPMLEEGRITHVEWRDYFRAHPEMEKHPEYARLGSADFHDNVLAEYDLRIKVVRDAMEELHRLTAALEQAESERDALREDAERWRTYEREHPISARTVGEYVNSVIASRRRVVLDGEG